MGSRIVMINTILRLTRPLVVLDCETTGVNTEQDRIIQLAITKHFPPPKDPIRWTSFINPGIPIPVEIQQVHGITDETLASAPKFATLAPELIRTAMTGVDFAGHGVMFDLKMFRGECRRASVTWDWEKTDARVIDTLRIRQVLRPNDLSTVYEEVTGQKLTNAHDAGADVEATEIILEGLLTKHPHVPRDIVALADFCWPVKSDSVDKAGKLVWRNGEACFSFGKWSGQPLRLVDRGYLKWVMGGDFPPETKTWIERALAGERIVR